MTDERTPTHCPHCGQNGGTDSLGHFTRTTKIKRIGEDERDEFLQRWFEFHCPDCDEITAMLESEECIDE